jgi:hypothetical protein
MINRSPKKVPQSAAGENPRAKEEAAAPDEALILPPIGAEQTEEIRLEPARKMTEKERTEYRLRKQAEHDEWGNELRKFVASYLTDEEVERRFRLLQKAVPFLDGDKETPDARANSNNARAITEKPRSHRRK